MKSIAFYYESSQATGGVNRVASIIASALADRGYRVHIISRYEGKYGRFTEDQRIVFHELFRKFHSKYSTSIIETIRLRRLVQREKIDVLVSTGGIFFALAQFTPARQIVWDHVSFWHGNPLQQYFRRLAAHKAEAVVTLTQDNRQAFEQIKGVQAKIITINNPVTLQHKSSYDPDSRQIISVGYVGRQKGFDLLLKAWDKIPKDVRSTWKLVIAGEDEGDMAELKRFLTERHIENVEFLGFRSDIPDLLARSSIYVMSSRWEGMPMVLLEAQGAGLPIVSFDCKTGPAEILRPDNGILVEPKNTTQLAYALTTMMQDRELRILCNRGANENITRFSIETIATQWVDVIEQKQKRTQ